MPKFKVVLTVSGSIEIENSISFNTDKELSLGDIFQSDIEIKPDKGGFRISSTVQTVDRDRALKVAVLFIGKMLDVLSVKTNVPLTVFYQSVQGKAPNDQVRRIIEHDELKRCFDISRHLNLQQPAFSRGINWYRKGLYSEEPFDKFLAFWNSITVIAGKYHTPDIQTKKGIRNQVWQCFQTIWGNKSDWPLIPEDDDWIKDCNQIRNDIAHGLIPIEIDYVQSVISKLDIVQLIALTFIKDWGRRLHCDL